MVENPRHRHRSRDASEDYQFRPRILIFLAWSCGTTVLHVSHFRSTLFRGDYDAHYGIVRAEDGVIEQDVTYEGSAVPDRIKLSKRRKA